MQQGIKAGDTLWLRFKYYSFLDLDPKVSTGTQSGQQDSDIPILSGRVHLCVHVSVLPVCSTNTTLG